MKAFSVEIAVVVATLLVLVCAESEIGSGESDDVGNQNRTSVSTNSTNSRNNRQDLWVVFDHMKPAIGHDEHKRPPSCILAGFNGTFNFEIGGANITTKIPLHAQARNHTCGLETQELHLRWNPHSRIKFYFEQDVNSTDQNSTLTGVEAKFISNASGRLYFVEVSAHNLTRFQAPKLFAFVCHKPLTVKLTGKATEMHDDPTNAREVKVDLVLKNLRLEVFREDRYYDDITHLKFDCVKGWPYGMVPLGVALVLLGCGLFVFSLFVIRHRNHTRKLKYENILSEEEPANSGSS